MYRLPHIVVLFASILLVAADKKEEQHQITLDKVRVHVKKAAEICRTTQPPRKPHSHQPFPVEPGGYFKTIEPVVSAGKKAEVLLIKLIQSKELDSFETRIARILLMRIKEPELFQKVEPYLKPFADNPLVEIQKGITFSVAPPRHWYIDTKPFRLELLHPDLRRKAEKHARVYKEIEDTGKKLWDDIQSNMPTKVSDRARDEEYPRANSKQLMILKSYRIRIRQIKRNHPEVGDDFKALASISFYKQNLRELLPDNFSFFYPNKSLSEEIEEKKTRAHLFDPKYLLAWEEAMVRPFPDPIRLESFKIVSDIDDPGSAPSVGELFRQVTNNIHKRERKRPSSWTVGFKALRTLAQWPSQETAIEVSELLKSTKDTLKQKTGNRFGYYLEGSNEWKEVLSSLENVPEMKEHLTRLKSTLKSYAEYKIRMEIFLKIESANKPGLIPNLPLRKWSNEKDNVFVEARLILHEHGEVWLRKKDGSLLYLNINKISKADQEYVKKTLPKSFPKKPSKK